MGEAGQRVCLIGALAKGTTVSVRETIADTTVRMLGMLGASVYRCAGRSAESQNPLGDETGWGEGGRATLGEFSGFSGGSTMSVGAAALCSGRLCVL